MLLRDANIGIIARRGIARMVSKTQRKRLSAHFQTTYSKTARNRF
jgi:hypothetical protein